MRVAIAHRRGAPPPVIPPILVVLTASFALLSACKHVPGQAFCSGGALEPFLPAVRLDVDGHARESRIAVTGSGFAVVWSEGTDPTGADTDLYGRVVAPDAVLGGTVVRITQLAGRSDHPRIARAPDGTLALAWRDGRLGTRDSAFAAILGPSIAPASNAHEFASPVIASAQEPIPAVAAFGSAFVVTWNGRGPDGHDHVLYEAMGVDGLPGGAVIAAQPDLTDRATAPVIADLGSHLFALADAEDRIGATNPPDVYGYVVDSAGTASVTRFAPNSAATRPELVGAGPDAALLLWCDARAGTPSLFSASFGVEGVVHGERQFARDACESSLAAAGTFFLAAWSETAGASRTVRMQALLDTGLPDGRALALANDTPGTDEETLFESRPDVAWNGSTAGVAWVSNGQVWFRPVQCIGTAPASPSPSPTP